MKKILMLAVVCLCACKSGPALDCPDHGHVSREASSDGGYGYYCVSWDGFKHGPFVFFNGAGWIQGRGSFRNGEYDGLYTDYGEDGRVVSQMIYSQGLVVKLLKP